MKSSDPRRSDAHGPPDHKENQLPMADTKPTTDQRVVRLGMPIEHRMILRNRIETWREGELGDLEAPEQIRDPDAARRRAVVYERLIEALRTGRIALPDEEARSCLSEAATGFEESEEWEETKVDHDSLWSLLHAVGGPFDEEDRPTPADAGDPTTAESDLMVESAVLERVLEVHPAHLCREELVIELGEDADLDRRDAVGRAVHALACAGLLHIRDDLITPTRAALRFSEILDR